MAAMEVGGGGACAGPECRQTSGVVSAHIHACFISSHPVAAACQRTCSSLPASLPPVSSLTDGLHG